MAELAYDERATNFFTTNTTIFNTATSALIGGLEVTVVGTGDPVMVEFFCGSIGHSAGSGVVVTSYFVTNGAVTHATSGYCNWGTSQGEGGVMRRRMVLADGVSYTFKVGLAGSVAGSTGVYGQYTLPPSGPSAGVMHLRVTD